MSMLPLCVAASRDDVEVLRLSKDDVTAYINGAIPDEYDPSLAKPVEGQNVINLHKVNA